MSFSDHVGGIITGLQISHSMWRDGDLSLHNILEQIKQYKQLLASETQGSTSDIEYTPTQAENPLAPPTPRTRKQIKAEIENQDRLLRIIQGRKLELQREAYQLSDEDRWYTEEIEDYLTYEKGHRKRAKQVVKSRLAGRVHWIENFTDEDTGQKIPVERSRIIKINGEWI